MQPKMVNRSPKVAIASASHCPEPMRADVENCHTGSSNIERQAEMLRRRARWGEPVSTTVISRKIERRVLKAFLHRITEYLGSLCGTQADGKPHREIIAMLANICFPDRTVDQDDVRKMLTDRRAGGSAR